MSTLIDLCNEINIIYFGYTKKLDFYTQKKLTDII